jgi:hypothetical protein
MQRRRHSILRRRNICGTRSNFSRVIAAQWRTHETQLCFAPALRALVQSSEAANQYVTFAAGKRRVLKRIDTS